MSNTATSISQYREKLTEFLQSLPDMERKAAMRKLARTDLYFLLRVVLNRPDIEHPWLFDRCREIQASPNGYVDLWAREHYKSTVITYGKTIQDILASHGDDPLPEWKGIEPTFGIFSCTRPIAKGFLRQIKREFEQNGTLLELFPDILWQNPNRDAPKWSEDDGLILRRKSNPKESTVEAWGLVDGQPTSKHFTVRVYDDVVTLDSVRSPEMIKKTTEAWELSLNLGATGGFERYIGTRYHMHDSYHEIIKREGAIPRLKPGTDDGTEDGNPVYWDEETLRTKRKRMGPYTFACQILQNPVAGQNQTFKPDWFKTYEEVQDGGMKKLLICDPANEKRKHSDFTALFVVGIGEDENYYILDMVRDKLNLKERWELLVKMHRKHRPEVYYEQYGMQADIAYFEEKMSQETYRFTIHPVAGSMAKADRIRRLIPLFEESRIWFPEHLMKYDYEGNEIDLVQAFREEEYELFPVGAHDDMLDALARICDPEVDTTAPNSGWNEPLRYPEDYTRWII